MELHDGIVYIDLDETLIHSCQRRAAYTNYELLFPDEQDGHTPTPMQQFDALVAERLQAHDLGPDPSALYYSRRRIENEVAAERLAQLGWQSLGDIDQNMDEYLVQVRPGIPYFLEHIGARAELQVCTVATRPYAAACLALAGVSDHFSEIHSREDLDPLSDSRADKDRFRLLVDDRAVSDRLVLSKLLYLGAPVPVDIDFEALRHEAFWADAHDLPPTPAIEALSAELAPYHLQVTPFFGQPDDTTLADILPAITAHLSS